MSHIESTLTPHSCLGSCPPVMHWTSLYSGKGAQEEQERESEEQSREEGWGAKPVLVIYVPDRKKHTNSSHLSQSCSYVFTD